MTFLVQKSDAIEFLNAQPEAGSVNSETIGGTVKVRKRGGVVINISDLSSWIDRGGHIRDFAANIGLHENTIRRLCHDNNIKTSAWNRGSLTDSRAAWVAACLDCEGMITAHATLNKTRMSRNISVYARVQMTCNLVPAKLHELCGGILCGPKPQKTPGHRSTYYWNISANGLRWLLPQLLPHLLTKKKRAEIALEILNNNSRGHSMPGDKLANLINEMRRLNRRGDAPTVDPGYADLGNIRCGQLNSRAGNEMIVCACGCNGIFAKFDRRGRERKFIHGHN